MQEFELQEAEVSRVKAVIENYQGNPDHLIRILQDIQSELGYVPKQAQRMVADKLHIPGSKVFGIISFYNFFQMNPPGKHHINVCMGTACYVRGANKILNDLDIKYGIKQVQTTMDRKYSMDIVRCIGCCAIGPVVTIDGKVHGKVTSKKLGTLLKECENSEDVS
jgi:NADH-quinone oxidoreductase subunit E/NADP-reducing hydrogenase subunit HndA